MSEFRWIQRFLFLLLLPHSAAAMLTRRYFATLVHASGVSLGCENLKNDYGGCLGVSCSFSPAPESEPHNVSPVVVNGVATSDRMSVTEDCALVITRFTDKDLGKYICESSTHRCEFILSPPSWMVNEGVPTKGPTAANRMQAAATSTVSATHDSAELQASTGCSAVDYIMLVLRVAEFVLITVITVLLVRAQRNQRPPDGSAVRRNDTVNYENVAGPSAPVGFNIK